MVHNGIEYGDMQLICEAYHLMEDVLGMQHQEMVQAFEEWNKTELDSFLIEITASILKFRDTDCKELLPKIRDSTGQKGTGKWTATGVRRACHPHRRSCLCSVLVFSEGGASSGQQRAEGPPEGQTGRQ